MVTSLTFSNPFPIPTINRQCDIVDICAISQSLGKCSIFQNLNDLAVEKSSVLFVKPLSSSFQECLYLFPSAQLRDIRITVTSELVD